MKKWPFRHDGVSFFIKENSWIARVAAVYLRSENIAVTIGDTIHLFHADKEDLLTDAQWLKHELSHVRQFQKYGFFRFIVLYFWETLKHGYRNNRFEQEARGEL